MSVYNLKGNIIGTRGEYYVNSVAHRGFSDEAPENTIPAFILAKKKGFNIAETDVSFTADGVAVLLHDATVDRTSNGTGNINSLTLEQVRALDFGSWKSLNYIGTQIPTFEEFILLCKKISLHPYIELKDNGSYTEAQIQSLVDIVRAYGLINKVTWVSYSTTFLQYVHDYEPTARILINVSPVTGESITIANNLKGANEVVLASSTATDTEIELCKNAKIPYEVGVWDTEEKILNMSPYITGVTSNKLHAGKVLYDSIIE